MAIILVWRYLVQMSLATDEEIQLIVCVHTRFNPNSPSCAARGAVALADLLEQGIRERKLNVPLIRIECLGMCSAGPNVRIAPGGPFFHYANEDMVPEILQRLGEFIKTTTA